MAEAKVLKNGSIFSILAGLCLAFSTCPGFAREVTQTVGGVRGSDFLVKHSGDLFEFSEDPSIRYVRPFKPDGIKITIAPHVPYVVQYPPFVSSASAPVVLQIRMRKAISTTYSITVAGVIGFSGERFADTTFSVRTPGAPRVERPEHHRNPHPGFFCALFHNADLVRSGSVEPTEELKPSVSAAFKRAAITCVRWGPIPGSLAPVRDPHAWRWARFDSEIDELARAGVTPQPLAIDAQAAPQWATGGGTGMNGIVAFQTPAIYKSYATALVAHVAAKYPQIIRFECGANEPNDASNFQNSTWQSSFPDFANHDGSSLAPFLQACYQAVHEIVPNAEVSAPGIEVGAGGLNPLGFIDGLYEGGCRYRTCWDVLTVHQYSWINPLFDVNFAHIVNLYGNGNGLATVDTYEHVQHEAMLDEGDSSGNRGNYPIAITETGFTSSPTSPVGLAPEVQAAYMASFFNRVAADRSMRYLVWSDIYREGESIFAYDSLIDPDSSTKPAFEVWREFSSF